MTHHRSGWYQWRRKDLVPTQNDEHANIAYDRVELTGGLTRIDTLISHCKQTGRALAFRLRAIPWDGGSIPAELAECYVLGSASGRPLPLPLFDLEPFWEHYTAKLTTIRDRIAQSGVALCCVDIDGLGRGGETHYYGITVPEGYLRPSEAHRRRIVNLYLSLFAPEQLVVPTDNAAMVRFAFALHPNIGWRRDSLGRPHYQEGAVNDGIWESLIARARNPKCYTVTEWYGQDPPVDVALGLAQIKASGARLVSAGNFGSKADNDSAWLAAQQPLFAEISAYLVSLRASAEPNPIDALIEQYRALEARVQRLESISYEVTLTKREHR